MSFDCIIVGGGPCGVSAGIYLKRAGFNVAIIEKSFVGGQIAYSSELSNYAGFLEKDTFVFCQNLTKQLNELEIPILMERVDKIEKKADQTFEIITNQNSHFAKSCILCLGAESRKLGTVAEQKFQGRGVSYCAVCDGNLYRGKDVLVIGGGNSAFEDAIYLSKICNKVYLINRSENFKAEKYLQSSLEKLTIQNGGNVEIITNAILEDLSGDNLLEKAKILVNGNSKELNVQGVFVAIGREPNAKFLEGFLKLDKNYIFVNEDFETSVNGIFAGGDCVPKRLRQVVTAVSDGAELAKSVSNFLQ